MKLLLEVLSLTKAMEVQRRIRMGIVSVSREPLTWEKISSSQSHRVRVNNEIKAFNRKGVWVADTYIHDFDDHAAVVVDVNHEAFVDDSGDGYDMEEAHKIVTGFINHVSSKVPGVRFDGERPFSKYLGGMSRWRINVYNEAD